MKDCLQIAECCLSSAKLRLLFELSKKNLDFFAKSFVVSIIIVTFAVSYPYWKLQLGEGGMDIYT